ncbi:MAG TPA: hypothetical protein VGI16_04870 [Candidatus Acidoferrum sp.]|jgi:hypothetical protein
MKRKIKTKMGLACLSGLLLLASGSYAQQKTSVASSGATTAIQAYDISRENMLQGTVVAFTKLSKIAPMGAHVTVQTSAGVIDVDLGSAQLLDAANVSLSSGESVKIVGETLPFGQGTQFFARILQKGDQAVALRSTRGFPLKPMGAVKVSKQSGGVS